MKTMNNFKRKSLKSAAVIVSFVLISLTVSAQSFWRELLTNNSFGEIAEAMSSSSTKKYPAVSEIKSVSTAWFNNYLGEAMENSLEVEGWILDEPDFDGTLNLVKPLKVDKNAVEKDSPVVKLSGRSDSSTTLKGTNPQPDNKICENGF
jgi:hypothetical protein